MKAYVVDDQRAIVEMLILMLEEIGVEGAGVTDPLRAHDAITAMQPDVVLLDILMPQLNGLTLLDTLLHDERTASIPVVLCTASVLTSPQGQAFAERGIAVLPKPFSIDQLKQVLRQVQTY